MATTSSTSRSTKRLTYGIMLTLIAWGIYLAIGATGRFVQPTMMDGRKSVIVLLAMALFLGLWGMALRRSTLHRDQGREKSEHPIRRWSRSGAATVLALATGTLLWCCAIGTWNEASRATTTILGWLAALSIAAAATAGMIALSDSRSQKGKWLGSLGLLGSVAAFVVFIVRMSA